jgi:hypothetical protein
MSKPEPISFTNDSAQYLCPSWKQMNLMAFTLSQKIRQDKIKFDRIITLAKGGWPMTRSLIDFLPINQVASIGVKFYAGINHRLETPDIYQDIPVSIKGETVLLFDDVADTGESLKFTKQYLETRGAKAVKTATLFYKPHSQVKPDYFASQTEAWIIFPYEPFESMRLLTSRWSEAGLSMQEIQDRFHELNFTPEFIQSIQLTNDDYNHH